MPNKKKKKGPQVLSPAEVIQGRTVWVVRDSDGTMEVCAERHSAETYAHEYTDPEVNEKTIV